MNWLPLSGRLLVWEPPPQAERGGLVIPNAGESSLEKDIPRQVEILALGDCPAQLCLGQQIVIGPFAGTQLWIGPGGEGIAYNKKGGKFFVIHWEDILVYRHEDKDG